MKISEKILFLTLCVVLVLATLLFGTVHQPILALFYISVAVASVLYAVVAYFRKEPLYIPLTALPIFAVSLYGFVQSAPFGSFTFDAVSGLPNSLTLDIFATRLSSLHFLIIGLFFVVTRFSLNASSRLRKFSNLIFIFGFVYAFFAIVQSVLSPGKIYGFYEGASQTPYGSFVNRHNFAAFMELAIAIPLGMLVVGTVPKDRRVLYILATALMALSLVLSGSRGGLVALVAEVAVIFLVAKSSSIATKIGLAAVLLVVVIGGVVYIGGESAFSRVSETGTSQNVSSNRFQIWSVTGRMIADKPVFGVGLGAYGTAYPIYDDQGGSQRVEQAHNDYLQVAADLGIVGILIGLAFLILVFRTASKAVFVENNSRRALAVGALAGIVAILVHSLFDFVLHITAISLLFVGLLALLDSASNTYEDDVPNEKSRRKRHSKPADVVELKAEA